MPSIARALSVLSMNLLTKWNPAYEVSISSLQRVGFEDGAALLPEHQNNLLYDHHNYPCLPYLHPGRMPHLMIKQLIVINHL